MSLPAPALPALSVVIPVCNEAGNVGPVAQELAGILATHAGVGSEIVFVDDGSTDSTAAEVRALAGSLPVRLIRHGQRAGISRALHSGIGHARNPLIMMLDGDGQNNPALLPELLAARTAQGGGLAAGIRRNRQDTASKRWASQWANQLRRWWLGDDCPDTGCGLKLFGRDDFQRLPFFDGMHRYLPVLFRLYRLPVSYVPVADRPRAAGRSKFTNWQRALVGAVDLLGVAWLQRRTPLPEGGTEEILAARPAQDLTKAAQSG